MIELLIIIGALWLFGKILFPIFLFGIRLFFSVFGFFLKLAMPVVLLGIVIAGFAGVISVAFGVIAIVFLLGWGAARLEKL